MTNIKLSEVLALSEAGNSKKQIQTHYGLTNNEINALYKHPKLKGLKPKTALNFIFEDDIETTTNTNNEIVLDLTANQVDLVAQAVEDINTLQEEIRNGSTISDNMGLTQPTISIPEINTNELNTPAEPVSENTIVETEGSW